MKLSGLCLAVLLLGFVSLADAGSRIVPRRDGQINQKHRLPAIPSSTTAELVLSYDFFVPGETRKVSLIVALPKTIPDRQKILSTTYSPTPSRIFDRNGNSYAEFVFIEPDKKATVEINITAELSRYDLYTAREKRQKVNAADSELEKFLKHERYVEKNDPNIQKAAQSIKGQTDVDIVKKIYNYVADNMQYTFHGRGDWGAAKALRDNKGDCTEYADLFVAICRAKNIPARVATGYTMGPVSASFKHNWAEVYLQEYGWVPFDPSMGDVGNIIFRDRAFSRLRPAYIYITSNRSDELLGNNQFWTFRFWGNRVRVTDSVEFKEITPSFVKTY